MPPLGQGHLSSPLLKVDLATTTANHVALSSGRQPFHNSGGRVVPSGRYATEPHLPIGALPILGEEMPWLRKSAVLWPHRWR